MNHSAIVVALVTGCLAPWAVLAQEPAITLEVPIDVRDLHPDITQASVACYVGSELPPVGEERGASGMPWGDLWDGGMAADLGRGGNLRTTVRVEIGATAPQTWRMQASVYRCLLYLHGVVDGASVGGYPEEGTPTTEEEARYFARPGTLVGVVEGTLPGG